MDVTAWLLDADPAIRWQVLSSLTDAPVAEVAAARARVPHEGIGAAILAAQGGDGAWHLGDEPDWVPTLYTMLLLRATGVDPADPAASRKPSPDRGRSSRVRSDTPGTPDGKTRSGAREISTVASQWH